MDRDKAFKKFEAMRRFRISAGKVVVREVALAAEIAALKVERRRVQESPTRRQPALPA